MFHLHTSIQWISPDDVSAHCVSIPFLSVPLVFSFSSLSRKQGGAFFASALLQQIASAFVRFELARFVSDNGFN